MLKLSTIYDLRRMRKLKNITVFNVQLCWDLLGLVDHCGEGCS